MLLRKYNSVPKKLNNILLFNTQIKSCEDFSKLILNGEQRLLTFGEISSKKKTSRIMKQKTIYYFYHKLKSKL